MARVKEVNLYWHYGDTFDGYKVVWLDSANQPINLTGYTATLKVKATIGGSTLLTLTSSSGMSINAIAGEITINATPAIMLAGTLAADKVYYYDLQVATSGSNDVKTLIKGRFFSDAQVSD